MNCIEKTVNYCSQFNDCETSNCDLYCDIQCIFNELSLDEIANSKELPDFVREVGELCNCNCSSTRGESFDCRFWVRNGFMSEDGYCRLKDCPCNWDVDELNKLI